jgi:hypothetical protein
MGLHILQLSYLNFYLISSHITLLETQNNCFQLYLTKDIKYYSQTLKYCIF